LGENDRISLIEFESSANRILPLTCFSKKNKGKIEKVIKGLSASGGTNIGSGMNLAFKIMKER
jgi:Mg-chelatase subunit ChlD